MHSLCGQDEQKTIPVLFTDAAPDDMMLQMLMEDAMNHIPELMGEQKP